MTRTIGWTGARPGHARRPGGTLVAAWLLLAGGGAAAQGLDVPVTALPDGQAAGCAGSVVSGLDPEGDNFLAVRAGPGTRYRKIDELHTGDPVRTCERRGDWIGIFYPGLDGRSGWVHGNYLTATAG